MTQVPALLEPRGMVIADIANLRTTTCIIIEENGGVVLLYSMLLGINI